MSEAIRVTDVLLKYGGFTHLAGDRGYILDLLNTPTDPYFMLQFTMVGNSEDGDVERIPFSTNRTSVAWVGADHDLAEGHGKSGGKVVGFPIVGGTAIEGAL